MDLLAAMQKFYPKIDKTAGAFILELTKSDLTKDIVLSAEMAGLMLLRNSRAKYQLLKPGSIVEGAVTDAQFKTMNQYVFHWAKLNGLAPGEIDVAGIPDDVKNYLPELTNFEQPFYKVCRENPVNRNICPFVAATAAMKLVLAGKTLGLLDANVGQAMVIYHVMAGSKTVPYPSHPLNGTKR